MPPLIDLTKQQSKVVRDFIERFNRDWLQQRVDEFVIRLQEEIDEMDEYEKESRGGRLNMVDIINGAVEESGILK